MRRLSRCWCLRPTSAAAQAAAGDIFPALAQVIVTEERWFLIELPDGRQAWIWGEIVGINPPDAVLPTAQSVPPTPTVRPIQFDPLAPQQQLGSPVVFGAPSVGNVTTIGTCNALAFIVNWSDPNGDGLRIDISGNVHGAPRSQSISGGGDSTTISGFSCDQDRCVANFSVVDRAGNRSAVASQNVTCGFGP